MTDKPLICTRCATEYDLDRELCDKCGLPLVYSKQSSGIDDPIELDIRSQASKIEPEYTHGDLVKVGWGKNQSEAEMIQMMLLEEGIPTTVRRSAGFDVPDFLAAGPRDVMAPLSAAEAARDVMHEADLIPSADEQEPALRSRAVRLLAGVLIIFLALGAVVVFLIEAVY